MMRLTADYTRLSSVMVDLVRIYLLITQDLSDRRCCEKCFAKWLFRTQRIRKL
jgi:hypothetical protein